MGVLVLELLEPLRLSCLMEQGEFYSDDALSGKMGRTGRPSM